MTTTNARPPLLVGDTGFTLNKHLEHQLGELARRADSSSSRGPAFAEGMVWSICGGGLWVFAVHLASSML
ncbi:hypothetical protein V4C53_39560 [Paraburkholderia azotifigens]|uniref:hypothetical protein n=1 Tax=Paraburkholderia azotifigens TaxID=2057004 RepID=UPI003174C32E